jgi:hypothetical protein
MNTDAWFILIYACPDAQSQAVLASGLRDLAPLVVETTQDAGDYFVIVESPGDASALTVHELVLWLDPRAELVDSHDSARSKGGLTLLRPQVLGQLIRG